MINFTGGNSSDIVRRGEELNKYTTVSHNDKTWICLRPQRQYSTLEYDIRRRGLERVPKVLFGRSQAVSRIDSSSHIWLADFVSQDELHYATLHEPRWLFRKLSERRDAILTCKEAVREIKNDAEERNLSKQKCADYLRRWKKINAELYPYMFLAMITDDAVVGRFKQIISEYTDEKTATLLLHDLLISEYTKNAVKNSYAPNKSKNIEFPPEELYFPEGEVVFDRLSSRDFDILERVLKSDITNLWDSIDEYFRYRVITPIIFQLSEENFYVGKSLIIAMNYVIDYVGEELQASNQIEKKEELLHMELDEVIKTIETTDF